MTFGNAAAAFTQDRSYHCGPRGCKPSPAAARSWTVSGDGDGGIAQGKGLLGPAGLLPPPAPGTGLQPPGPGRDARSLSPAETWCNHSLGGMTVVWALPFTEGCCVPGSGTVLSPLSTVLQGGDCGPRALCWVWDLGGFTSRLARAVLNRLGSKLVSSLL